MQQWHSNSGTVFSVRSLPRCYKQDKSSVSEAAENCCNWGRGQFETPDERERPPLEALTRRLLKTQQAEKT
jgi:hypothetical protein